MPAQLLNGKELADKILLQVKDKVANMDVNPGLAAILVGDNQASKLYLKLKEKACDQTGITFSNYILSEDCDDSKILEVIDFLNKDPQINGIIVQLPLPKKFDTDKIISTIEPGKDIDGFHKNSKYTSPIALGVLDLLKETKIDLTEKNIAIISNSEKFSAPFQKLLKNSRIEYLNPESDTSYLSFADIIISAVGKPHFIKPEMIKKDAILIDVGISELDGKTVGDIDPACDEKAAWRSPVPGGVGPMTVAMLLQNLISLLD